MEEKPIDNVRIPETKGVAMLRGTSGRKINTKRGKN